MLRHVGHAERPPRTFTCSSRQDRWNPLRQQSVTSTGSSQSFVLSRQIAHMSSSELLPPPPPDACPIIADTIAAPPRPRWLSVLSLEFALLRAADDAASMALRWVWKVSRAPTGLPWYSPRGTDREPFRTPQWWHGILAHAACLHDTQSKRGPSVTSTCGHFCYREAACAHEG